jgi:hypothetical protein
MLVADVTTFYILGSSHSLNPILFWFADDYFLNTENGLLIFLRDFVLFAVNTRRVVEETIACSGHVGDVRTSYECQ